MRRRRRKQRPNRMVRRLSRLTAALSRRLAVATAIAVCACGIAFAAPLSLTVTNAMVGSLSGEPVLLISLSSSSARDFAQFSISHLNQAVAILIDHKVVMKPVIRDPILGGSLEISWESAADCAALAERINTGKATVEVELHLTAGSGAMFAGATWMGGPGAAGFLSRRYLPPWQELPGWWMAWRRETLF